MNQTIRTRCASRVSLTVLAGLTWSAAGLLSSVPPVLGGETPAQIGQGQGAVSLMGQDEQAAQRVPVVLERSVFLQTAEGQPVTVPEGHYFIDASPTSPLTLIGEMSREQWRLSAQIGGHAQSLVEPKALSIAGPDEDEHHIVLLLPDGQSVDASGSYSGVTTRAARVVSPTIISKSQSSAPIAPVTYTPRPLLKKPSTAVYYKGLLRDRVVVKFKEGAVVRLMQPMQRSAKPSLALVPSLMNAESRKRMQRLGMTDAIVQADLGKVNQTLTRSMVQRVVPLFARPDLFLQNERVEAERRTGREHADLGNYFLLVLEPKSKGENLVDELNALPSVEIAYLAPIPVNAQVDSPPPTPNYEPNQSYLDAPLRGIDARYAWTLSGGKGAGVRVIDVELAVWPHHEDLPQLFVNDPSPAGISWQHGTAVLGVMAAFHTGFGITGIAPGATYGFLSTIRPSGELSIADAVNAAASRLAAFDVLLIEVQAHGPSSGETANPNCNPDQFELIPVEYWPAEFDAIQTATSRGIHVVEVAGNGSMNLDAPRYERRFDRSMRDSGAIVVGARALAGQFPTCFSNFGTRLDVNSLGEQVWTTGHPTENAGWNANVPGAENDMRQWYTSGFGGTSGASAIVAGAVASLSGIQQYIPRGAALQGVHRSVPSELRALLRETGSPQLHSLDRPIGPQVNLRNAVQRWSRGLIVSPGRPDGVFVP